MSTAVLLSLLSNYPWNGRPGWRSATSPSLLNNANMPPNTIAEDIALIREQHEERPLALVSKTHARI